jgi:hypothetical protein
VQEAIVKAQYYFVGGPLPGKAEEFLRRLNAAGGPPPGWRIYPHASHDGRALHLVEAASLAEITSHLKLFADIYQCGEIIEIVAGGRE